MQQGLLGTSLGFLRRLVTSFCVHSRRFSEGWGRGKGIQYKVRSFRNFCVGKKEAFLGVQSHFFLMFLIVGDGTQTFLALLDVYS